MSQDREKKPLTKIQAAVLKEISAHVKEHGIPPTARELGAVMKRAISGVNTHLWALERKGWIQRKERSARSIRVMPGEPEIIEDSVAPGDLDKFSKECSERGPIGKGRAVHYSQRS